MKKIGILVFAAAIIIGVCVSSLFSFGRFDQKFFSISFNKKTKGSGRVVVEAREIKGFSGVDAGGIFQVEIVAQKDFGVEVEADDNLIPLINTEVRNGILHIETARKIATENGLKVRISAPDIESINASGISKVTLTDLKNAELRVDTSGAPKVRVTGETGKFSVNVSGASSVDADSLRAETADIEATGASRVSVFATGTLRADVSGASKLVYDGNPENIEKSTTGASSVRKK